MAGARCSFPLVPSFLRALPYPVLALTATDGAGTHASLVSWVTQVSFEPRLVAVALERDGRALHAVRLAGRFALATLPSSARRTASRVGRTTAEAPAKLDGVRFDAATPGGVPLLAESAHWAECERREELATGDHILVVAEVIAVGGNEAEGDAGILTLDGTGWRYAG